MSRSSSSHPHPPPQSSSSSSASIAPHPHANAFSLTFQSSSRPRQPGIVPAVLRKQGSTVRSASASRSIHTSSNSPSSAASPVSAGSNTGVAPYRGGGNSQSQRHNHERPPSATRMSSAGSLSSSPEEATRSASQSRRQRMASQPSISISTGGFASSPTSTLTAPSSPIVGTDGVQAKGTALPRSDWQPDSAVTVCQADDCHTRFSAPSASSAHSSSSSSTGSAFGLSALSSINPFTARRHHCRACGRIFCAAHSSSSLPLLAPKDSGLSPRTPVASSSNLFGMLSPAFSNGTNTPATEQPGFNFTSFHSSPTQESTTSAEGQTVVRKMRVCDLCHLSLSLGSDLLALSPEYQAQQREREQARILAQQQLSESPSVESEGRRPSYASNSSSSSSVRTHGAGQHARLSGIKSTPVSAGHSPHASHALSRSEDRPPAQPSAESADRSARERQESAASTATSATTAASSSASALSSGIRSDESNERISGSAQSGKDGDDEDDARSVKTACTTPPRSSSSTTTALRRNDKQGDVESRPSSAQGGGVVVGGCIAPAAGATYRFPDTADADAEFARTRTVSRAGSPRPHAPGGGVVQGGIGAALHPLDPRHGKEEGGPSAGVREEGANVESSGPAHSLSTLVGSVRDGWTWSTF